MNTYCRDNVNWNVFLYNITNCEQNCHVHGWLKTGLGLVIGFINNFQFVTTINYYTSVDFHTTKDSKLISSIYLH
jgi:hypothetical protein